MPGPAAPPIAFISSIRALLIALLVSSPALALAVSLTRWACLASVVACLLALCQLSRAQPVRVAPVHEPRPPPAVDLRYCELSCLDAAPTDSTPGSSPSFPASPGEEQARVAASPSEALISLLSCLSPSASKHAVAPAAIMDKLSAHAIDQAQAELVRGFATARRPGSRVLVTGATGFLGNLLVRALLRQGRTVRVLVLGSDSSGLEDIADRLDVVVGDITRAEDVERAVGGCETVFHLASLVSLLKRDLPVLARVNVLGTQNVVEACLVHGVDRLVYVGSIHALAALPESEPISEARPLAIANAKHRGELSPYDLTKAMAEQAVIDALPRGLRAVRVTPVGIWGPGDRLPSLLGRFLLQLWERVHPLVPSGGFFYVDVRDVVHGCLKAEEFGVLGKRYIFRGHYITMPMLAARVHAVTGESRPWTPAVPMWIALASAYVVQHFTGDAIGFNPSSIRPFLYHQQITDDETQADLRGLTFRPVDVTLRDAFDDFVRMGYCAHGAQKGANATKAEWGGLNCRRDEVPVRVPSSGALLAAQAVAAS